MPEPNRMENRALIRRTLITVGAMVGACVLVVGSLALVATLIVGRAVAPPGEADAGATGGGTAVVPAGNVHGTVPMVKPQIPAVGPAKGM